MKMKPDRNDMIGAACAVVAIGLIAWLALDSWAIARCEEFIESEAYVGLDSLTAEQEACLDARLPLP